MNLALTIVAWIAVICSIATPLFLYLIWKRLARIEARALPPDVQAKLNAAFAVMKGNAEKTDSALGPGS